MSKPRQRCGEPGIVLQVVPTCSTSARRRGTDVKSHDVLFVDVLDRKESHIQISESGEIMMHISK